LYDYRTLFHGTSTHSKEDQREVAGVKAHSKKLNTCRWGAPVRVGIAFCRLVPIPGHSTQSVAISNIV